MPTDSSTPKQSPAPPLLPLGNARQAAAMHRHIPTPEEARRARAQIAASARQLCQLNGRTITNALVPCIVERVNELDLVDGAVQDLNDVQRLHPSDLAGLAQVILYSPQNLNVGTNVDEIADILRRYFAFLLTQVGPVTVPVDSPWLSRDGFTTFCNLWLAGQHPLTSTAFLSLTEHFVKVPWNNYDLRKGALPFYSRLRLWSSDPAKARPVFFPQDYYYDDENVSDDEFCFGEESEEEEEDMDGTGSDVVTPPPRKRWCRHPLG